MTKQTKKLSTRQNLFRELLCGLFDLLSLASFGFLPLYISLDSIQSTVHYSEMHRSHDQAVPLTFIPLVTLKQQFPHSTPQMQLIETRRKFSDDNFLIILESRHILMPETENKRVLFYGIRNRTIDHFLIPCCSVFFVGPFRAAAIYPLNYLSRGRDLSMFRNPPGILGYVRSAPGPDRLPGGSYQFFGRPDSYIYLPNRGKLDTKTSISILAWVKHDGRAGPIFHYKPNGWGLHLWMVSRNQLFVRFTRRQGRASTTALSSSMMKPHKWQYIAATYDYISGYARLYLDSKVVAQRRLGRFRLATNYPVRIGANRGDRRYFRGQISCVMVFDVALNPKQIARRKKRCFRGKWY